MTENPEPQLCGVATPTGPCRRIAKRGTGRCSHHREVAAPRWKHSWTREKALQTIRDYCPIVYGFALEPTNDTYCGINFPVAPAAFDPNSRVDRMNQAVARVAAEALRWLRYSGFASDANGLMATMPERSAERAERRRQRELELAQPADEAAEAQADLERVKAMVDRAADLDADVLVTLSYFALQHPAVRPRLLALLATKEDEPVK